MHAAVNAVLEGDKAHVRPHVSELKSGKCGVISLLERKIFAAVRV